MSGPNSQHPSLTKITQNFVADLESQNAPPLYTLSPQEARQVLLKAQSGPVDKFRAEAEDLELPVGPGGHTRVRLLRKDPQGEKAPLILYIHGGGWVMGNKETHDRLVRELAHRTLCTVAFVDYDPSPEARYPHALEQCYAVLEHLLKNAGKYNLDPARLIVAGDSVGGNLAIALVFLAKERHGPKIGLEILFYPVTDAGFDTASYGEFAEGPWLTLKAMKWFWDAYLPEVERRGAITVCPLRAKAEDLKDFPPTVILTAENDVLRDEGEAFARKLNEAGVEAASVRFNGTIHDFVMLNALAESGPARAAVNLAVSAVKAYLKKSRK